MKKPIGFLLVLMTLTFSPIAQAKDKTFNVRLNPLGLLLGNANVGVDVAVSEHFTVGGQVQYVQVSVGDTEATASSFGVRGQAFINEAFSDSWYFAATYDFYNFDVENKSSNESASVSGGGLAGIVGYMWMWTNFNIMLGGGIVALDIDEDRSATTIDFEGLSSTYPVIEFNLGWAF